MTIPTVFILAGGLGTRLTNTIGDVPKPMAMVAGKPFLEWQILCLARQGFEEIVLLVGHKHKVIQSYFKDGQAYKVKIFYSIEDELLGTGGATLQALERYPADYFIIMNGDTYFDIDLKWLFSFWNNTLPKDSLCMALKYCHNVKRYGRVTINPAWAVKEYLEKEDIATEGYINGGIYVGSKKVFAGNSISKLSMERDIFPALLSQDKLFGIPFGDNFIDIGIPADYRKANSAINEWFAKKKQPALFLDRDGILIEDTGYVRDGTNLVFIDSFFQLAALAYKKGYHIVVVTNQAGIAKGLLAVSDVEKVNRKIYNKFMQSDVQTVRFYFCPYHESGIIHEYRRCSLMRKPMPGMILQAIEDLFIDAHKSIMIGDKDSDRINLPYLKSYIVKGKYPILDLGDVVDLDTLKRIVLSKPNGPGI